MIELIKFGAEWCGPCKMVAPTITKLQEKYNIEGSDIQVTSIDVDKNPEFSQEHRVQSIPTFIFKKDGKVHTKKVGVLRESEIEKILEDVRGESETIIGGEVRGLEE